MGTGGHRNTITSDAHASPVITDWYTMIAMCSACPLSKNDM